ncbi:MAG: hypothetical protein MRY74_01700 [Neomegalonema sp.]|nr:hypothetical protein [Neomegalonema sp.]
MSRLFLSFPALGEAEFLRMRDEARSARTHAKKQRSACSGVHRVFARVGAAFVAPNLDGRMRDKQLDAELLGEIGAAPKRRAAAGGDAGRKPTGKGRRAS